MTLTQLYWLITLPKLGSGLGGGLLAFGLIGLFVQLVIFAVSHDRYVFDNKLTLKQLKLWITITMICVGTLLSTFIPTTKEIVAIYGINYVTNEKSLKEIPPKLFELANIKLDDLLK